MAAAFGIALQVQWLISPFAAAWLPPFLFACIGSFYLKGSYKDRGLIWYAAIIWLLALVLDTFFIRPVPDGVATMWLLAALPIALLCLRPEHLRECLIGAGAVLALYAGGVLLQALLHVKNTDGMPWHSWPVSDPNNAACLLNFGGIYCFARMLKEKKWLAPWALFTAALMLTESRAGIVTDTLAMMVLYGRKKGFLLPCGIVAATLIWAWECTPYIHAAAQSFSMRYPIWLASLRLITWRGYGWGTFEYYYPLVRTEHGTVGTYAHNDLLQFWIEGGVQAFIAFCLLIFAVIKKRREDIKWRLMLGAVFLQALVEFQFYMPAISILCGLALSAHYHSGKGYSYDNGSRF